MQLNGVVFPAPECSYTIKDFPGELLFIPRNFRPKQNQKFGTRKMKKTKSHSQIESRMDAKYNSNKLKYETCISEQIQNDPALTQREADMGTIESDMVPCLFLPYYSHNNRLQNQNKTLVESEIAQLNFNQKKVDAGPIENNDCAQHNKNIQMWINDVIQNLQHRKPSKIMIFFHGNAEDIGIARSTLNTLKQALKISILAVEYSGYGLCVGEKSADKVLSDSLSVYDFVHHEMGVAEQDIIIFGRSLGSSPCCFIAKERPEVGCMMLMSPFKSLREVAKDHVGKILSYLLAERYRNVDLIAYARCPVLIIHGMSDSIIDVSHSYTLKSNCGSDISKLVTPDLMEHNTFKLQDDVIAPIKTFIKENGIRLHKIHPTTQEFKFSADLFYVPKAIFDYDLRLQQQKLKPYKVKDQIKSGRQTAGATDRDLNSKTLKTDPYFSKNEMRKNDQGYFKRSSKSQHYSKPGSSSQQVTLNFALEENKENHESQTFMNKRNPISSRKNDEYCDSTKKEQSSSANIQNNVTNWQRQSVYADSQQNKDQNLTNAFTDSFYNMDRFKTGRIKDREAEIQSQKSHYGNLANQFNLRDNPEGKSKSKVRKSAKIKIDQKRSSIGIQDQANEDGEFNLDSFDQFLNNYEQNMSTKRYNLTSNQPKKIPAVQEPRSGQKPQYWGPGSQLGPNKYDTSLKLRPITMSGQHQSSCLAPQEDSQSKQDISLPDIRQNRIRNQENDQIASRQNTDFKSIRQVNQQTPQKIVQQKNTTSKSFNLSPQSVKQSLPPGESVEGGTTIQNSNSNARSMASHQSKVSQND